MSHGAFELMARELRRLVKHSGVYGLGIVMSKLVGFIMVPVYTHFLRPHDYGILELLDLIVFLATSFASMGIYSAVFRFYALYESEREKKEVISTALYYSAAGSLIIALGLGTLAPYVAKALLGDMGYAHFVRIVAATFFFSNLSEVPLASLQARERSAAFIGVGISRTVLGATGLVIALVVLKLGVEGVLIANCLTNALTGVTLSTIVLLRGSKRLVKGKLEEMLRYGLPLVPAALGSFVLTFSDRFFLRRFGSLEDVGVYALGYKLAMVVAFLTNIPFALSWQWHQFDFANKQNAKDLYAKVQIYQLLLSLFVGIGISVLARDVLRVMTPQSYWGGAIIVPFIVLCYVLDNTRTVVVSGVLVQRATYHQAWIGAIVTAADLALNYFLISRYLALGAAFATVLAYTLRLALTYLVAQHVYFVRYDLGRSGIALVAASAVCVISFLVKLPVVPSIGFNLLLIGLFGLISFRILQPEERNQIRKVGVSAVQQAKDLLAQAPGRS